MKVVAGVVCAAILLGGSNAEAQRPISVGISAGAVFPLADLRESHNVGHNVAAHLQLRLPRVPLALRVDGFWNVFTSRTPDIEVDGGRMRIAGGTANAVYELVGSRARPYLIAGVGAYNQKFARRTSIDYGFNAGVGGRFRLAGLNTFAEARFHRISGFDVQFQFIPVTVGIEF
jgi:hypothetical protein